MRARSVKPFAGVRIRSGLALIAAVLGLLASASAASAATIVSGPLAPATNYLTPNVTISPGEPLFLQNLDLVSHDITSRDTFQPKPRPRRGKKRPKPLPPQLLFSSALIGFGQTAPVTGTERLQPGIRYPYFCSLHPSMTGTLTVR